MFQKSKERKPESSVAPYELLLAVCFFVVKLIKRTTICYFFLLFNLKKSGPDIFIPVISFATADKVVKILSLYKNVLSS